MAEDTIYRGAPPDFPKALGTKKGASRVDSVDDRLFLAFGSGAAALTIGYAVACVLEPGHPAKALTACAIVAVFFLAADHFLVRRAVVSLVFDGPWVAIYRAGRLSKVIGREAVQPPAPRAHTRFDDDDLHAMRSKLRPAKHILVSFVGLLFAAALGAMGSSVTNRDEGRLLVAWSVAVFLLASIWLYGSLRVGVWSRRVVLDDTADRSGVMFSKSGLTRALSGSALLRSTE